ncbi:MAG: aspartate carbamoyltransferase [Candidatus Staskawiczbacteria bacterium RIFCSPHIGHO2_02_FULL_42_22]|uniref:Aspartate carbamoyltransferase n=1 Tax=Candidatus Staskawiczbacteria bacterium RIFCSPHIGHO2_02_FULL_42_22 TaxID=1802207 RepID=A0A1G2I357_9BACT|nr:MAG: aspartate carbamoyltransferase [Candidatus Staskawiczbacteria bacterium RIFCSPHIGHO2_02_FULL_42_22]
MKIATDKWDGYPHVLGAGAFSKRWLQRFFGKVEDMEQRFRKGMCDNILRNKKLILIFSEPSTRTSTFLTIAAQNLGANVIDIRDPENLSSMIKGEPFTEMIQVLSRGLHYGSVNGAPQGVIAIRHKKEGTARLATQFSCVPIINAGDGKGEHPTQGLLDVCTIQRIFGKISGLSFALAGDLLNGRTVHTLPLLLSKFDDIKMFFVSPPELAMPKDIKEELRARDVQFAESTDLREVAPHVDVIYQTRTQRERGSELDKNDRSLGYFIIDRTVLDLMKQDAIIMHPLPKVPGDTTLEVDQSRAAVYFTDQLDASIITKMTLFEMMFFPEE